MLRSVSTPSKILIRSPFEKLCDRFPLSPHLNVKTQRVLPDDSTALMRPCLNTSFDDCDILKFFAPPVIDIRNFGFDNIHRLKIKDIMSSIGVSWSTLMNWNYMQIRAFKCCENPENVQCVYSNAPTVALTTFMIELYFVSSNIIVCTCSRYYHQ